MYKIIGGDQKQYGPVSADEVRHWIADGRLNAQSLAWAEGTADWKPLGSFSEFADALRTQAAPPPLSGAAMPPGTSDAYRAEILARYPQIQIGRCLKGSWDLVTSNFGLLFGAAALVWAIRFGCNFVPYLGPIINWVLRGALIGGLYLVFLKRIRREPAGFEDLFSGFQFAFLQLFLVGLVSGLLTFVAAFCCLLIPGLYLFIAWIFSIPLVADKRFEFWTAMELSRKVVTKVWFEIFGLFILVSLPALLVGLGAGLKVAIDILPTLERVISSGQPDTEAIRTLILQTAGSSLWMIVVVNVVSLLNFPFVIGALAHAYEDLFGTRRAPSP
jgi:hypothetical protein